MKIKNFLLLLLVIICFTACVETIQRKVPAETVTPEYTVEEERLKSRIASIVPAEKIRITTSKTETTGKPEFNTLHVEILGPETFPSNGFTFSGLAGNIQETVEESVSNIEEFQKMEIVVRHSIEENGTKQDRSFKKVFDL